MNKRHNHILKALCFLSYAIMGSLAAGAVDASTTKRSLASLEWEDEESKSAPPISRSARQAPPITGEWVSVDKGGKVVSRKATRAADPRRFIAPQSASAKLWSAPSQLSQTVTMVISGTAAKTPTEGTTVLVDGAAITYVSEQESGPGAKRCTILARSIEDGAVVWKPTGLHFLRTSETGATPPLRVSIKVDPTSGTWDLFHKGLLMCERLALVEEPSLSGKIKVSPGRREGAKASLIELNVSDKIVGPKLPVTEGRLDIAAIEGAASSEHRRNNRIYMEPNRTRTGFGGGDTPNK